MSRVNQARAFCIAAHSAVGQKRKYTGEPYWTHPVQVAQLFSSVVGHGDEDAVCAALLHDVIEDTGVTVWDIREVFGGEVATMVAQLTDVSRPSDGNRAARKALDRSHLGMAWPIVKSIKLADLICNSESILKHDPKFAPVYLGEMRQLLEVLRRGNQDLWDMANKIVEENIPCSEK